MTRTLAFIAFVALCLYVRIEAVRLVMESETAAITIGER